MGLAPVKLRHLVCWLYFQNYSGLLTSYNIFGYKLHMNNVCCCMEIPARTGEKAAAHARGNCRVRDTQPLHRASAPPLVQHIINHKHFH